MAGRLLRRAPTVMPIDGFPHEIESAASQPERFEQPDAHLVTAYRAGDTSAFESLVRRHYRAAFSIALANLGTSSDAEDVCHDAFVRAAERIADCKKPDQFAHWLCAITRNLARNTLARQRVRRASALEHDTAPSGDNPERDAELSELRARLIQALGRISPIQREVVLLHDLDGWSHEEIAPVIGTSSGMSRQHLFKARKLLRALLGEHSLEEHSHE